jgi:glutamate racemase
LMETHFQAALGEGVKIYSQANLVAESLADYIDRRPDFIGTGKTHRYFTSGDPARVSDRATQFMRREISFEPA